MPDVLVVGAGPAGCIAAIVLARAGARVALLDRSAFPRDKLCGDTLNPGTLAMVRRLDAEVAASISSRAVRVSGMVVTGPGTAAVAADYPDGLYGVAMTRRDLDALLLDAAARAGADVRTGVHVHEPLVERGRVTGVRAGSGAGASVMAARLVIGADGRRSNLAFGLGLARFAASPRRWAFGAYFEGVDRLSSRGEMHIRPDGYIGVAPLPDGIANVCVVRERQDVGRAFQIAEAIESDPVLRERFAKARQVSGVISLGPLAVDASAAGCPGLLLAGDAAGFVDPMTGDGMRFAIRGGELAALAAQRELDSGEPAFAQLGADRRREFAGKWRINRALRSLIASPPGLSAAAYLSRHWTGPVRALIGVAGDVRLARPA